MSLLAYPRLYRLDVVLLSFFSVVVGAQIAGALDTFDVVLALCVCLLSMNFVYSFNSWSDWRIDAINKPHRPIPAGQISPRAALIYSLVLLAGAVLFPLLLVKSPVALAAWLTIPALGWAYSARPVRLKRFPPVATAVTSVILVAPMVGAYYENAAQPVDHLFFVGLLTFCLAVIPLKDIEDEEGDVAEDCGNWAARIGWRRLLLLSGGGLCANLAFYLLAPIRPLLRFYLCCFAGSTLLVVILFGLTSLKKDRLYKTIIRVIIVEGIAIFALRKLDIALPFLG